MALEARRQARELCRRAHRLLGAGDVSGALELAAEARALDPDTPEAAAIIAAAFSEDAVSVEAVDDPSPLGETRPAEPPVGRKPQERGGWSAADFISVLISPRSFFSEQRGYEGSLKPFCFALGNLLIVVGAAMIVDLFGGGSAKGMSVPVMGGGSVWGVAPFGIACASFVVVPMALVAQFVGAGCAHLIVMLFGGHGGYAATYRTAVYANTGPTVLTIVAIALAPVAPLPPAASVVIIVAGTIWAASLTMVGYMALHDMSVGRAIGAMVTPYALAGAVAALMVMLMLSGALPAPGNVHISGPGPVGR